MGLLDKAKEGTHGNTVEVAAQQTGEGWAGLGSREGWAGLGSGRGQSVEFGHEDCQLGQLHLTRLGVVEKVSGGDTKLRAHTGDAQPQKYLGEISSIQYDIINTIIHTV